LGAHYDFIADDPSPTGGLSRRQHLIHAIGHLLCQLIQSALLRSVPEAERLCAKPIPLSGTVARAIAALVRDAISVPDAPAKQSEPDIVAYLSAMLRIAAGANHELSRPCLFRLIDTHLRANIAAIRPAPALAAEFGISERTFHRIFADLETTFERHVLHLRVELFRNLLRQASLSDVSITRLALQCAFKHLLCSNVFTPVKLDDAAIIK